MHRETKVTNPDGSYAIRVEIDASKGEQEVRKVVARVRKRNGGTPLSEAEMNEAVETAMATIETVDQPLVNARPTVDLVKYQIGVVKIVYELACLWLGDAYLDDSTALVLRDCLIKGSIDDERLRGTISLDQCPGTLFWQSETTSHIAYSCLSGSSIGIVVKIFDCMSATLLVTEHSGAYTSGLDPDFAQFVRNDTGSHTLTRSSFLAEMARLSTVSKRAT